MEVAVGDMEVVTAYAGSMAWVVGVRSGGANMRDADNASRAAADRNGRVNGDKSISL